jgi:hypothetical protein
MQTRRVNVLRWTIISHKPFGSVVAAEEAPSLRNANCRAWKHISLIDGRMVSTDDEMASFLALYGNGEALRIGRDLDAKVKLVFEEGRCPQTSYRESHA